jgi:hypothetical protein
VVRRASLKPSSGNNRPTRLTLYLLRDDSTTHATAGFFGSECGTGSADVSDLQRYIDVTRGEMFFARGIILVERDAELYLLPAFAQVLALPQFRLARSDWKAINPCRFGLHQEI